MKVVVVHLLAQSFGHCPVALIGVHDGREDVLLTAHDLHGGFIGIGIKLFRKFIAAVVVEISGVHIKHQLAVFDGIRFQTSGGDHSVLFHLLKHFYIIVRGCFEMNVQRSAFRHDVLIAVAVLFTLIVFLYLSHICRGFQVLIPGYGAVYSIISCHRFFSFLWDLQTARSYGEALFQSVITHYYTFIHTGCKVPWALRGLLRRGCGRCGDIC